MGANTWIVDDSINLQSFLLQNNKFPFQETNEYLGMEIYYFAIGSFAN